MGRRAKAAIANPFYALLVVAGIAFVITACAYGVMTLRGISPRGREVNAGNHPLLELMETHGSQLLLGEIVALAVASFAAMATDDYWIRKSAGKARGEEPGRAGSPESDERPKPGN